MREAGASQASSPNFLDSPLLAVPEVYWDFCTSTVMTMQRMRGTPVSRVQELRRRAWTFRSSRASVEIFFTQVFRDGFFHADMHPGNILVNARWRYVALDFGIMGTLTEVDKTSISRRTSSVFFRRDYGPRGAGATSRRAGCRPIREWTSSKARFAPCASRSSTGR